MNVLFHFIQLNIFTFEYNSVSKKLFPDKYSDLAAETKVVASEKLSKNSLILVTIRPLGHGRTSKNLKNLRIISPGDKQMILCL